MKFSTAFNVGTEEEKMWDKIKVASQKYYEGNPIMSDEEFDQLYTAFKTEYPESKHLKEVGSGFTPNNSLLQKVRHKYGIVGSLDKIHAIEESLTISSQDASLTVCTTKLDGASLVLYYVDGYFDNAVSRGDGTIGLDVSDKAKKLVDTTVRLIHKDGTFFTGAIRGEVVMSNEQFEEYKAIHTDAKLARNIGTGILMRKDNWESDIKYVSFVCYKIIADETFRWDNYVEMREQLKTWGFNVVRSSTDGEELLDEQTLTDEEITAFYNAETKYPTDGVVLSQKEMVTLEDGTAVYDELAYKFPEEIKETTVTSIDWNLSRTGKLVPLVNVEPVLLTGATVKKSSGFNYDYIKTNKIGPGAVIKIMRSGAVIPDIQSVVTPCDDKDMVIPTKCPHCGGHLSVTESGKDLVCNNPDCTGGQYLAAFRFLEVLSSDIDGVGPSVIDEFLNKVEEHQYTVSVVNVIRYFLVSNVNHCTSGETPSITKKFTEMWNTFHSQWSKKKFLMSLNIPLLGDVNAEQIANSDMFDVLIENCGCPEDLEGILLMMGMTPALANSIRNSSGLLKDIFSIWKPEWKQERRIEKYVCITGSLSIPRKAFEDAIAKYGWGVTENITKAEYLITNNPNSGSSKNVKAQKAGKAILTEEQFREILKN